MIKQLRRQAIGRQKGSLELVGGGPTTLIMDLVPLSSVEECPRKHKKRGSLELFGKDCRLRQIFLTRANYVVYHYKN